ncbi:MAG: hypothetical protein Q7U49_12515 [Rhodoferax sp.]|uniref:hypothetical protein n=1 Tax=Rhodoferax sp. TaxID=50421 RepID=UPI0027290344|nr:hypothetical protein [Rhodoferax sp.]MDO9145116.1 hypothetical protein [Rhodoferax sp.]MDP3192611.1 hypothetical protein [Rhodoferax sp.]MDP3864537.1 hypothetical protein [Rhodoferax sp.]
MPVQTREQDASRTTLAIRRESFDYGNKKPNRIPPADSPNRPQLARLWVAAFTAANKRRHLKTFTYGGRRYGVIYLGFLLCVADWQTRRVLVKPPASMAALAAIVGSEKVAYQ